MRFIDKVNVAAQRSWGRELSEDERRVVYGYAPDEVDPEEFAGFLKEWEGLRSTQSGRHSASADWSRPEWWDFYVERAFRETWGQLAQTLRAEMGLTAPVPVDNVRAAVDRIIKRSKMRKSGARAVLFVPGTEKGTFLFTGIEGEIDARRYPMDEVIDGVFGNGGDSAYMALVYTALCAGWERNTSIVLQATPAEFHAFVLCDVIPERPWIIWTAEQDLFADNITLRIPTISVTPEQVRTMYEQIRDYLSSGSEAGRTVPVAVTSDRMALVGFVDSCREAGQADWATLHEAWKHLDVGGEYGSWQSFKAAYHAAARPARRYSPRKLRPRQGHPLDLRSSQARA